MYQEMLNRIEEVNKQVAQSNATRQTKLGQKQALEQQLARALANYKAAYGVDLKPETIESELARVKAETEAELTKVSTMLNLVQEGRYAEAEQLATGLDVTVAKVEDVKVEEIPEPVVNTAPVMPQIAKPEVVETLVEEPKVVVTEPTVDVKVSKVEHDTKADDYAFMDDLDDEEDFDFVNTNAEAMPKEEPTPVVPVVEPPVEKVTKPRRRRVKVADDEDEAVATAKPKEVANPTQSVESGMPPVVDEADPLLGGTLPVEPTVTESELIAEAKKEVKSAPKATFASLLQQNKFKVQ